MKIDELTQKVIVENEKLFKSIPEKKAKGLARAVIKALGSQIDELEEGKISIQGLGTFRKKNIEKEGVKYDKILFKRQKKKTVEAKK